MSMYDSSPESSGNRWDALRREMVARQLRARGIQTEKVLEAFQIVPRHLFIPPEIAADAYSDSPLPIGKGQTISQPYIVAKATEALSLEGNEKVLEIGAGCGYQAAILSRLAQNVIAIESQSSLAFETKTRLAKMKLKNIHLIEADGSEGWAPCAPYQAILVSAAAPRIPQPLVDQLAMGARMVIPVGNRDEQELLRIIKTTTGLAMETICNCRYVPLLGHYGWSNEIPSRKPAGT